LRKLHIILLLFLFAQLYTSFGQDVVFSQYTKSSLALNPALAGQDRAISLSLNARKQWTSLNNSLSTNQLAIIIPFKFKSSAEIPNLSLGFSFINDKVSTGYYKGSGGYLTLAYNIQLNPTSVFSLGVQSGLFTKTINAEQFQWNSQFISGIGFDASNPSDNLEIQNKTSYVDLSSGIYFHKTYEEKSKTNRGLSVGVSMFHLNSPDNSIQKSKKEPLPFRTNIHASFDIKITEKISLSPQVLFVKQFTTQTNVGTKIKYHFLVADTDNPYIAIGAYYRLQDAYIASASYNSNMLSIGFSYDMNASTLSKLTKGASSYELFFKFMLPERHHKSPDQKNIIRAPRYSRDQ